MSRTYLPDNVTILTGFLTEYQGPYAITPNTVELIPTLGTLPPPRQAGAGHGPHNIPARQRICQRVKRPL